ncbi:MAG TPA: dienelactone hydrolase family protein [Candidatus Acidoferrales bacterium]|nr:dienelactone hydrolase family protein [Candidatus Acidoferrales bacterium]
MAEELAKLVREYRDGRITRREFMRRALAVTGSLAAANALIEGLADSGADAAQVDPSDPALVWHHIDYPGKAGPVFGYLVRPVAAGKYPGIIVIHANQGINDHFRDIARRLAKEGYVALVPDYLSRRGGTMKVNPKGRGLEGIRELIPWQLVAEDTDSGYAYLRTLPDVRGDRMGLIGFCWGGEMTFAAATQVRGLRAAVVFYGRSPNPIELVRYIEAPILAHYGEKDPNVNKDIAPTEEAMRRYEKSYTYKIYPGAQHGFHSDTNPERYHPEAAKEAWARTLEFLRKHLKG